LLGQQILNKRVAQPVSGQQPGKHVPTAKDTNGTIEQCFLCGPCREVKPGQFEAGSNTTTVVLRVVEGDEKRSLESETVKYGHEFHGTRTRE
jgi:hypothetical protein